MYQSPNPQSHKWFQANNSDLFGNISVTKNITFDTEGYLQLSNSGRVNMNETVDTDFEEAAVIVRSDDHLGYWVATHDQAFKIDADRILATRATQDTETGVPTGDIQTDAVYNSGLLIVTQDNDVDYYTPSGNTWTDTNIGLTATTGSQHPIENFLGLAAFAIGNVNTVLLYSNPVTATPTLLQTLTIPSDYYVTSLAYFNQNLYIGTMHRFGGEASMFVWNGKTTAAQSAFEVDSVIIFDLCVHQDSVVLITGNGQILRYVGSGFQTLDNLPIYYTNDALADETNVSMFHNCLKSNGEVLYINVSTDASNRILVNMPAGIWCYDAKLGFAYHKYALSGALVTPDVTATTDIDTTTNVVTVTAAPVTGTEVIYYNGGSTNATPLVDATRYYVIKTGATTIKLATTYANAIASTAIDLTGTGNNAQSFIFAPSTDYGQYASGRACAILPIQRTVAGPEFGTDIIYGGGTAKRTPTDEGVLGTFSTVLENRGYVITPWYIAGGLTDRFHHVGIRFSKFKGDLDKIIIKYRLYDDRRDSIINTSTRWLATWTSSTTFTTTESLFSSAVVGDEIEFLRGGGAGILAHITVISENAGTYTVTIDETYLQYESGDTCRFVFRNWKKLHTISSDAKKFWDLAMGPEFQGTRIQFKVELRGVQTRIEDFLLNNKSLLSMAR